MNLSSAIDTWLAELAARQYSALSIAAYAQELRHLLAVLGDQDAAGVRPADIRRTLSSLHSQGLAPRTLAHALSVWRGLFRHLGRHGQIQANPCTGIRPPRGEKRLPHTLSPDDLSQLLRDEAETLTPLTLQDHALFELAYSSGLRRAELIGLDIDAIDRQGGEVRVRGKGSKERIVPVGRQALAAIEAWLAVRHQLAGDTRALFVGSRGGRISASVLAQRLKRLALRQGLTQPVHPHALRHSFASHVLQSSGDLRAVQEMLGHASLSTTQVYTHLDFQHLAQAYDAAHPRASRKVKSSP